jgi:hypothetical protein
MNYQLAAAAKSVGMSTILRAIKSGRITSRRGEFAQCRVDTSNVHHVLPAVAEQRCEPDAAPGDAAPDDLSWRAARIALAEQRLTDLKAMLEEMRTERDAWREQAQRLSLPKSTETSSTTSWWRWLRSTG